MSLVGTSVSYGGTKSNGLSVIFKIRIGIISKMSFKNLSVPINQVRVLSKAMSELLTSLACLNSGE